MSIIASGIWEEALDPSEEKDYSASYAAEMAANADQITASTWSLSAEAIAAGIIQPFAATFGADTATLWLAVAPANQSDLIFEGRGVVFQVTNQIETQGGRTYEKTIEFIVRQK